MTKTERVQAALQCEPVDRIPMSIWLHHSDIDQDPMLLAETQVAFMKKYDLDFIKLMPFGLYSVVDWGCKLKYPLTFTGWAVVEDFAIKRAGDWNKLQALSATQGTWGKQVQLAQQVGKLVNNTVPFIQTIFSPLTTAEKMAGNRLLKDMQEHPELVHRALQVITDTTISFIKANIEAGVSGFFFASQMATYDLMTVEAYQQFGCRYDLQLFDSFKDDTFFNVVHIHGDNIMFETLANYPVNCVNWHDRWVAPSLGEARKLTAKCLLGGINENAPLTKGTALDIEAHIAQAVRDAGRKGLMIGPGCVADPLTPAENYYAARIAVGRQ